MLSIRSVMSRAPRTIAPNATVKQALETLEVEGIRHLPVVEAGRLIGIVSDRDVRAWRQALLDLRDGEATELTRTALEQPLSGVMTREVHTVRPEMPVEEAVALLLDHKIGALPVVQDDERLVGMISILDLLSRLEVTLSEAPPAAHTVGDRMTRRVFSVGPRETLDRVLWAMLERGIRHLPVVDEEDNVIGVISHRDLFRASRPVSPIEENGNLIELMQDLAERRAEEVMSIPETITPELPLPEAARILLENHFGCLPVVEGDRLVGILTESDFVRMTSGASA